MPREELASLKAGPPVVTKPPTTKRLRRPVAAPLLFRRNCQRWGCTNRVRYDSDRFCSPAHQLADLQERKRDRAEKRRQARAQIQAAVL